MDGILNALPYWGALCGVYLLFRLPKSRWFKGKKGEFYTGLVLNKLPKDEFIVLHNVTLPTKHGTTQIDHIVVCSAGVVVVESKHLQGFITIGVDSKYWSQQLGNVTYQFYNPLRQNKGHVKALKRILTIPHDAYEPLVVFTHPNVHVDEYLDVMTIGNLEEVILSLIGIPLISDDEKIDIINTIQANKLPSNPVTDFFHARFVKQTQGSRGQHSPHTASYYQDECAVCDGYMIRRHNSRDGSTFYGCSNFPHCRRTESH